MSGYNPNRHGAGSPDGGRFAPGDSQREDAGQVDLGNRVSHAENLRVGDRVLHDGEHKAIASIDGDHRTMTVELDDGSMLELDNDQLVDRLPPESIEAGSLQPGDRIMESGFTYTVESVSVDGHLATIRTEDGSIVMTKSDHRFRTGAPGNEVATDEEDMGDFSLGATHTTSNWWANDDGTVTEARRTYFTSGHVGDADASLTVDEHAALDPGTEVNYTVESRTEWATWPSRESMEAGETMPLDIHYDSDTHTIIPSDSVADAERQSVTMARNFDWQSVER